MLILSRFVNESIIINGGTKNEITIMVVGIENRKAKIGIEAPREFPVHRTEVYEQIKQQENEGK